MSKLRICDRCGRRLERKDGIKIDIFAVKYLRFRLDTETEDDYDQHDLCNKCMDDFKAFIKGARVLRKEDNDA
jgi:hypothetical protein